MPSATILFSASRSIVNERRLITTLASSLTTDLASKPVKVSLLPTNAKVNSVAEEVLVTTALTLGSVALKAIPERLIASSTLRPWASAVTTVTTLPPKLAEVTMRL